ncbi:MAG: Uracil-DNA glycosylase [Chlamydiia bacterium]|nr:Uracil-DNA glycosylase [Chlamydiia bacterium]MCH9616354.1 Uracil-DNA glycosylase [Chlamydiia bacterium]MCH9629660.1 Uracil-DNA glycosylase [Chlamydiia bacterium]
MSRMSLEKSWHEKLKTELEAPYIARLKDFLAEEKKRGMIVYPPEDDVFSALRHTPFDQVKVVIVGQDPYHGPGQAHGLSFSVKEGIPVPPSLKNIYKELKSDLGIEPPTHGCLEKWADQGVLMLNATLTVRAREPRSHNGRGWEQFTDAVIRALCLDKSPKVFILWGRSAKEKCQNVLETIKHPHAILTSAHPSPFSAVNFLGCKHFSKANRHLIKWGKSPIDWKI